MIKKHKGEPREIITDKLRSYPWHIASYWGRLAGHVVVRHMGI
jgi:transposase-like protein